MNIYTKCAAELIRNGHAVCLDDEVVKHLDRIVNSFPWIGTHLSWHTIPNTCCFDWGKSTDIEATRFVRTMSIGHFDRLCGFYGISAPVLLFSADWLLSNLDLAAIHTQQYFLFGYGDAGIDFGTFAEFETGSTIWGWKS